MYQEFHDKDPPVCQGDIFRRFPVFFHAGGDPQTVALDRKGGVVYDKALPRKASKAGSPGMVVPAFQVPVVVLTQTCDLVQEKHPYVTYAPVLSVDDIRHLHEKKDITEWIQRWRRDPAHDPKWLYYLRANADEDFDERVVDFCIVCSIRKVGSDALETMGGKANRWLRLASPFRESLSQKFGYYYSKVAVRGLDES